MFVEAIPNETALWCIGRLKNESSEFVSIYLFPIISERFHYDAEDTDNQVELLAINNYPVSGY